MADSTTLVSQPAPAPTQQAMPSDRYRGSTKQRMVFTYYLENNPTHREIVQEVQKRVDGIRWLAVSFDKTHLIGPTTGSWEERSPRFTMRPGLAKTRLAISLRKEINWPTDKADFALFGTEPTIGFRILRVEKLFRTMQAADPEMLQERYPVTRQPVAPRVMVDATWRPEVRRQRMQAALDEAFRETDPRPTLSSKKRSAMSRVVAKRHGLGHQDTFILCGMVNLNIRRMSPDDTHRDHAKLLTPDEQLQLFQWYCKDPPTVCPVRQIIRFANELIRTSPNAARRLYCNRDWWKYYAKHTLGVYRTRYPVGRATAVEIEPLSPEEFAIPVEDVDLARPEEQPEERPDCSSDDAVVCNDESGSDDHDSEFFCDDESGSDDALIPEGDTHSESGSEPEREAEHETAPASQREASGYRLQTNTPVPGRPADIPPEIDQQIFEQFVNNIADKPITSAYILSVAKDVVTRSMSDDTTEKQRQCLAAIDTRRWFVRFTKRYLRYAKRYVQAAYQNDDTDQYTNRGSFQPIYDNEAADDDDDDDDDDSLLCAPTVCATPSNPRKHSLEVSSPPPPPKRARTILHPHEMATSEPEPVHSHRESLDALDDYQHLLGRAIALSRQFFESSVDTHEQVDCEREPMAVLPFPPSPRPFDSPAPPSPEAHDSHTDTEPEPEEDNTEPITAAPTAPPEEGDTCDCPQPEAQVLISLKFEIVSNGVRGETVTRSSTISLKSLTASEIDGALDVADHEDTVSCAICRACFPRFSNCVDELPGPTLVCGFAGCCHECYARIRACMVVDARSAPHDE